MFRMQILPTACPRGGQIHFRLELPMRGLRPEHQFNLNFPTGQRFPIQRSDSGLFVEDVRGQGVWGYHFAVTDPSRNTVLDRYYVEVNVLETPSETASQGVEASLKRIGNWGHVSEWATAPDIQDTAMSLVEQWEGEVIVALLTYLRAHNDEPGFMLRALGVLRKCLSLPEGRQYQTLALPFLADIAATHRGSDVAGAAFQSLCAFLLQSDDARWRYLLDVFARVRANSSYFGQRALLSIATALLGVPETHRSYVLELVRERIEREPELTEFVVELYLRFDYREGLAPMIALMAQNRALGAPSSTLAKAWNRQDYANEFRAILPCLDLQRDGGMQVVRLLCDWKDEAAVPAIVQHLRTATNTTLVTSLLSALQAVASAELAGTIQTIAQNSEPEKARLIAQALQHAGYHVVKQPSVSQVTHSVSSTTSTKPLSSIAAPTGVMGYALMDDGTRVPFTQCHSTIDGQRLGIGNSVSSARNSSRKVNLANVARIEFLALTDEHKREMGVSPTQVFRSYGVRPANVRLNTGEELAFVFLETHLWNWYGPVMDGAFSEIGVVGVEFVRNEAQSREGAA